MERIVSTIMRRIRTEVRSAYAAAVAATPLGQPVAPALLPAGSLFHKQCELLYLLCKTRKYKSVVKFFPHEVADVEPALHALACQDSEDFDSWQSRYTLLMWLSILVLIPFDLTTVDSSAAGQGGHGHLSLVQRIVGACKGFLSDPGPVRDAGAICLARLLSRPDMDSGGLAEFFAWATHTVQEQAVSQRPDAAFTLTGVLTALAVVAKTGHREVLAGHLGDVLQSVLQAVHTVHRDPNAGNAQGSLSGAAVRVNRLLSSALVRKLVVKLASRTGLALLPPKIAPWRYQRGKRSLLSNMSGAGAGGGMGETAPETQHVADDADVDIPLDVEDIIDMLLTGLRDSDTIVRWSAAKGVGRITARLPWELGDEVVQAVLSLLVPAESDGAWHGACLATAELARRGLLLPERLGATVPLVLQALSYDVRRGAHSIGTHVRDAACYVAWAFARAYAPQVMAPYVMDLARGMMAAACFDREVNCRRAASAAFQENVGRQGHENFKHGIEILTCADYFTLGNRANAYLTVAPAVAVFPEYRYALIDELLHCKLHHWDAEVRQLSALGLGAMVKHHPEHFAAHVLPWLIPRTLAPDLFVRHGAMLATAEIVLALAAAPFTLTAAQLTAVRNVVPRAERARAYRGRGGQMVRGAACRLIEVQCLARHSMSTRAGLRLLATADECLRHPHEDIQQAAAAAWAAILRSVLCGALREEVAGIVAEGGLESLQALLRSPPRRISPTSVLGHALLQPLHQLKKDDNPAVRRGMALALGALPRQLFVAGDAEAPGGGGQTGMQCLLRTSLAALREACIPERIPSRRDAETRRNAAGALGTLITRVGIAVPPADAAGIHPAELKPTLRTLLRCTRDYATDTRGDVGSWVRRAAITSLHRVTTCALAAPLAAQQGSPTYRSVLTNATPLAGLTVAGARAGEAGERGGDSSDSIVSAALQNVTTQVPVLPDGTPVVTPYGTGTALHPVAGGAAYEVSFPPRVAPLFPYGSAVLPSADVSPLPAHPPSPAAPAAAPLLDADAVTAVVAALLRLLGEKLDVVRSVAGSTLARLLHCDTLTHATTTQGLHVPALQQLREAFPAPAASAGTPEATGAGTGTATAPPVAVNYSLPHHTFPRLVPLLGTPTYTHHIMQGLCLSVGGLSESVVKHSAAALRSWAGACARAGDTASLAAATAALLFMLRGDRPKPAVEGGAAAPVKGEAPPAPPLLEALPDLPPVDVVVPASDSLGAGYKVAVKTVLPTLTTLDVLLGTKALLLLSPPHHTFALHALPLLRYRTMRSKDPRRVMAAAGVVLGLMPFPDPVGPAAAVTALDLLGHPFPKVRHTMATRLYQATLTGEDFPWAPPGSTGVLSPHLIGTPWTAEWRDVVPVRDTMYAMLGLPLPDVRMGALAPDGTQYGGFAGKGDLEVEEAEGAGGPAPDENASYLALVKDAGY